MKLCPKCGHRLQDGFQICPFDGTEVVDAAKMLDKNNWTEAQKLTNAAAPRSLTSARLRRSSHTSIWQRQLQVPLALIAIVIIGLLAWGATVLTNSSTAAKKLPPTLDELAHSGDLAAAISILERRKNSATMIGKEHEMLNKLYLQEALKLKDQGNIDEALDLLKKVPVKSDVYAEAAKLSSQLKKKH